MTYILCQPAASFSRFANVTLWKNKLHKIIERYFITWMSKEEFITPFSVHFLRREEWLGLSSNLVRGILITKPWHLHHHHNHHRHVSRHAMWPWWKWRIEWRTTTYWINKNVIITEKLRHPECNQTAKRATNLSGIPPHAPLNVSPFSGGGCHSATTVPKSTKCCYCPWDIHTDWYVSRKPKRFVSFIAFLG